MLRAEHGHCEIAGGSALDKDNHDEHDYHAMTDYLLRGVPPELWRKVRAKAAIEGRPVSQVLLSLLDQYVAEQSGTKEKKQPKK